MTTVPAVIRHVEAHLGVIDPSAGYWRFPVGGSWLQVVAFRNQPRPGATTLCSLGLWHHELSSPTGNVRQELVLAGEDPLAADGRLACLFPCVAEAVLANLVALAGGQVFGPFGPVLANVSPLEWLLCLAPTPVAQSFAVCDGTEPPTHFVRLVPISAREAAEVGQGNLGGQERRWDKGHVDLLDWQRRT